MPSEVNKMYFLAQQFVSPNGLPQTPATSDTLGTILQIVFTIIGALALLMLVIAGFRYVISSGEPQKTAEIRRQIIYTAIGLILAASADAIVTVIINRAS
jgi:hypothetical protein